MHRLGWSALLLAACAPSPEPGALFGPPVSFQVGPAIPGQPLTVTLLGAPPLDLQAALAGTTDTGCAVRLFGLCSDLGAPVVRGAATGTSVTLDVPAAVPVGATLHLQLGGRLGNVRRLSPVIEVVATAEADCSEAQAVADTRCTSCHGAAAVADLDLRDLGAVVGVASAQSSLPLVTPGDRDASYLFRKAAGTHAAVGTGGQMPPNGALASADLDALGAWIDAGATCGAPPPTGFTCDPAAAPSPTPMRRLTRLQYERALEDAVFRIGGPALGWNTEWFVDHQLWDFPEDHADRTLSREDQAVSQAHAEGWYVMAEGLAEIAVQVGPACGDASCMPGFIADVGSRVLRHPLSTEERDFFLTDVYQAAGNHPDGFRDVVLVWLTSPWFTHQIEHGDPSVPTGDPDTVALTPHELANRLSLHAWNAPPDDALWALAESGQLLDPAVYDQQVDRLFADPRAQLGHDVFVEDWLQLHEIPILYAQVGLPGFDAFRGSIDPGWDLHDRVRDDLLDLWDYHLAAGNTLDDLFTGAPNTVMDPAVGALYGLAPSELWDGVSAPAPLATGHGGLLTRPAFHVTGTTSTRPIHKGVLVRRRVLCDQLGDPPADLGVLPYLDPASSQRERTELLTERPGTVCNSCHEQINGLGYLTEGFDALGRVRSQEDAYDVWSGDLLATWPVDDAAVAQVEHGDTRTLTAADALGAELAASGKPDACLSRFWFRHTWGRTEDDAVDGCVLQDVEQRLASGESLDSALRASARSDAFRLRRMDEGAQP